MNWKHLMIIAILTVGSLYLIADTADNSDAATGTYTDGNWTFNVVNGSATIVSNTATGITNLVIPSTVSDGTNTYNVTAIGGGTDAIIQNSQLSSGATLTIPNGVTSIGNKAFQSCSGLTGALTIPDSVTTIANNAFYDCSGLTSLDLGEGVQILGSNAFYGCSGLTSLDLGEGVTSIGQGAFQICTSLTSVTIPDSVTSIGQDVFAGCTGLTSLDFGEGVTSIGQGAFQYCRGLTSLTIPNSVTSIGKSAFRYCSGLTSVTIGNSVTSIDVFAFDGCTGVTTLVIKGSPTSIGTNAFKMDNLETVYNLGTNDTIVAGAYGIPSTATVLTYYFEYTLSGSNATITNVLGNVTSSLDIPATIDGYTVTRIGNGSAVIQNSQLSSGATLTIPNGVTSIGNKAFQSCSGLTGALTIPDSVTTIGNNVFKGCTSLTSLTIGDSVRSIGTSTFHNCTGLTGTLTIPDSVTSIGSAVFYGCSGLTSLTIPDSVTSIGGSAFQYCSGLTSVMIGDSVTSIGDSAFYNCTSLPSVTIPNSVTSIGGSAFNGCTGVTTLIIEGSPTTIGTDAFRMVNLVNLVNLGTNESIVPGAYGIPSTATLYRYWFEYTLSGSDATITNVLGTGISNLVIPSSIDGHNVTAIGNGTDKIIQNGQLSSGATLTIPNGVTSIENYAFQQCTSLTSVVIPDSVTSIGNNAFFFCNSLASLDLGEGVQTIGNGAFYGCFGLTSLTIPDSVTTIGTNAFQNCGSLTGTLTIPDSVTSIGNGVFYGCNSVTTLIIDGSPTTIGTDTFKMDNLEKVINLGTSSISAGSKGIPTTAVVVSQDYPQDGSWLYSVSGSDATIIAKVGKNFASVEIPSTVTDGTNTYNVTVVGNGSNVIKDSQLSSGATLNISDGITSIGQSAFYNCSRLSIVTIPDSITTIGENAFSGCRGLTSVDFGEGVQAIGNSAFQSCSGLTSITIPDSVTSIGNNAFFFCNSLASLDLGEGVQTIGKSAFYGCDRLISTLVIPDSVTSIESSAFFGCTSVTTLVIEGTPITIGNNAFKMDNLTKLGNFGTNTSIVAGAYGIPNNVEILSVWYRYTLDSDNNATLYKILGDFNGLTIPGTLDGYTVTAIGNGTDAIIQNSQIASDSALTIPIGITTINGNAFQNCSNLTGTLTIPDSVTTIGESAFAGCSGFNVLINLSGAAFGSDSLNMSNVSEVLNLGDTELNPGSYGLPSTCTVKTEIDADSYIAPASIKESHDKEGAIYTILSLLPLFIILGALVMCATIIVRKN